MNMETKRDLKEIKMQLEEQLNELLDLAELKEEAIGRGSGSNPDRSSLSQSYSSRQIALAIQDKNTNMIKKIQRALERIETGDYGVCQSCGGSISLERLAALPYAASCIKCKTRLEKNR